MDTALYTDFYIIHAVFLFAYVVLGPKLWPGKTYINGVFLYFIAYVLLTAVYAGAAEGMDLYHGDVWLFVFGSALFMHVYATRCNNIHTLIKYVYVLILGVSSYTR